jgi:hypothetical protein
MKKCKLCLVDKNFDEYHVDNKKKDGHYDVCKVCRKIKSKDNYEKNKIKDKKIILGKVCNKCLDYKTINNFHKHIGNIDGYRSICKKCRKLEWENNYPNIFKKHRENSKKWRENNKEKYNEFFKNRYIKLPHTYAWRGMLSSMLRRFGKNKEKTTIEILGYSAEDLKNHMESLFLEDMTWENWGLWQIDHIRPISSFEKTTDPKIVNALTNLQPLWKKDNIIKSNKF